MNLKLIWRDLVRAQRRVVELQAKLFSHAENAKKSPDGSADYGAGGPGTVRFRMYDLIRRNPELEFTTEEVAQTLGVDPNAVRQEAYNLIRDHFIIRAKRGVYRAVRETDHDEGAC